MLFYILLLAAVNYSFSFNPSCSSCKWFIPQKKDNNDYGLCGFYKNKYDLLEGNITIYEFATHCRKNESMCGEKGYMYEPNDATYQETTNELKTQYEELSNRCCGEVNETTEIEQLEKEMFEIMQKIRKHNTKYIYKRSRDLYKLFKRTDKQ
jgi:hypothetical protein